MSAKWYPVLLENSNDDNSTDGLPFGNGYESMAAAECYIDQKVYESNQLWPGKFSVRDWRAVLLTPEQVKEMRGE